MFQNVFENLLKLSKVKFERNHKGNIELENASDRPKVISIIEKLGFKKIFGDIYNKGENYVTVTEYINFNDKLVVSVHLE
jgi:hypothetical protein